MGSISSSVPSGDQQQEQQRDGAAGVDDRLQKRMGRLADSGQPELSCRPAAARVLMRS
jgi:hypothetical protein